jgi:hypothetical protein
MIAQPLILAIYIGISGWMDFWLSLLSNAHKYSLGWLYP